MRLSLSHARLHHSVSRPRLVQYRVLFELEKPIKSERRAKRSQNMSPGPKLRLDEREQRELLRLNQERTLLQADERCVLPCCHIQNR